MNRAAAIGLAVALAVGAAGGCKPEPLGGGLTVVNDTDERLFILDRPIPPGEHARFEISDCSDRDLMASTRDGSVVAKLTETWCPDQTWTVRGEGESSLSDRSE